MRRYTPDGINAALQQTKDDDDPERTQMREQIQGALQKRYADSLSNVTYAASEGDVETVKTLLHGGLPVDSGDYDFRTTLHLSASEGNLKVVEALIEEGANVSAKDRWGQTPLQDAVNNHHGHVIELLQRHGAKLDYEDPGEMLRAAAIAGDLKRMKQLIDNGVDPNGSNYDNRTAFHLAAAAGKLEVLYYLLAVGAKVNVRDRWDGTPLENAVIQGEEVCAMLLKENKATLHMDSSANAVNAAVAEGDLNLLRLLAATGASPDICDYDGRTALMLATWRGQLLTVDYLVNACHANVGLVDRWHKTAFHDSLTTGNLNDAVIIRAAGGKMGPVDGGDADLLATLDNAPEAMDVHRKVGQCSLTPRLTPAERHVEGAWVQLLKL